RCDLDRRSRTSTREDEIRACSAATNTACRGYVALPGGLPDADAGVPKAAAAMARAERRAGRRDHELAGVPERRGPSQRPGRRARLLRPRLRPHPEPV